ncbi:hypothetical protein HW555_013329 [Spodoptera exigua]|uniref:Uncharacterized protein n=1 Tax=Spodoptera exigua TaxID=7107 RepID=A0A835G5V0_SPOEX|nr:hypothetical protein HW555_013329 [Spodoptera exigua]
MCRLSPLIVILNIGSLLQHHRHSHHCRNLHHQSMHRTT